MKYVRALPSADPAQTMLLLNNGWKKLKEPKNLQRAILLSLPLMFLNGALTLLFVYALHAPLRQLLHSEEGLFLRLHIGPTLVLFLLGLYVLALVHELLHASLIPNARRSEKTFWGIKPLYGFVVTEEELSKGRFILLSLFPLLVLSFLLPLVLHLLGLLNGYTILLCLCNATGSGVDCLNAILVAKQVPHGGRLQNNGPETYYR